MKINRRCVFFILAINPGATTTEIGYFRNDRELWRKQINHSQDSLPSWIPGQLQIRFNSLKSSFNKIAKLDAIAARGGPLKPLSGGIYSINTKMLSAYKSCEYANHASNLAALVADKLSNQFDVPAFIVDPITTDEFIDVARISGVPGIERKSRSHALNFKYCVHKAASEIGIDITNTKFIVAHLGSGFSIAAVKGGKIIDVNDALLGMGPFSIQRAGSLPISGILNEIFSNGKTREEAEQVFSQESGLKGYLGTNQFQEIEQRIKNGDKEASLIVSAMVYQITKEIGGLHAAFSGKTSALILTGGLANSNYLIKKFNKDLRFIQPHLVYPGSFELEALVTGVLRVLNKKEVAKEYL
ncbi:MAG: butyrate kinase [Candidatus Marinimicrobia bacterium]|nr:butyrate kinase [Candidatus Neomarinimicrobiota bacterium]